MVLEDSKGSKANGFAFDGRSPGFREERNADGIPRDFRKENRPAIRRDALSHNRVNPIQPNPLIYTSCYTNNTYGMARC